MKNLRLAFICVILIMTTEESYCQDQQSAFYDAKFIYNNCFNKKDRVFTRIVSIDDILSKKYYPIGTVFSFYSNPFFALYELKSDSNKIVNQSDEISSFRDKGSSFIGGFDVTKYANAIADIMMERAKQELTIAFFNRFKKFSELNSEFKILFPKTTDNLSNLLTYSYPQMLPALRNGFFEDIKQITYHLDDVLELPRYQELLMKFPEIQVAVRSINIIHELETKSANAADVIKDFASFKELSDINTNANYSNAFKNYGASVKLGSIFSESLRETDTSKHRIWVTMGAVDSMFKNEDFFNIYMGLIYQQCKTQEINFYLDSLKILNFADSVIAKQKNNLLIFQTKITELISMGNKVSETLADLKSKEKISNDDIYNYINVSIDVIEYAQSIPKIFNVQLVPDNYLLIAKKSNALYKDV